jgi:hypothetical protein
MSDGQRNPQWKNLSLLLVDLANASASELARLNAEKVAVSRGLRLDWVRYYLDRERQSRR